jgi:hypothetical protein
LLLFAATELKLLQGLLESLAVACARARAIAEPATDSGISMSVKVNTASEKAIQKLQRKAQRKGKNLGALGSADIEFACMAGWGALQVCCFKTVDCTSLHSLQSVAKTNISRDI